MAVDSGPLDRIAEPAHEAVKPFPQTRHAILTHFSANAHRKMIWARKRPGIALKVFEKLHAHQITVPRHVIAEGEHEVPGSEILRQKRP